MRPQIGYQKKGSGSLGKVSQRYGVTKKLAEEDTKRALQKATEKKKQTEVIINPEKNDIIGQGLR